MKKFVISILSIIAIGISACTNNQKQELTETDKETIKKELKERVHEIIEASENRDVETLGDIYWNNEDFISVRESNVTNYQQYMQGEKEFFQAINSIKFNQGTFDYRILNHDMALLIYKGTAKIDFVEGPNMNLDAFTASLLFRKIDNVWKAVYSNEYAVFNPVVQDSTVTD